MALLLIVDLALLFWNINTLSPWHMLRLLNLFSFTFLSSFLMAVIHIFSMTLFTVSVVNLCIIFSVAFLIIMCCTLCIMYSCSVRFLYTMTRLARFVPTLILPYSLADVWDAGISLRGYEQQWQHFRKHDLRADEPTLPRRTK